MITKLTTKLYHALSRFSWSVLRPLTLGVRVLLLQDEQVLLVRHTYSGHWYLPGGGVKKYETVEQALRRECAEEVGATLNEIAVFGIYSNFYEKKSDHIVVFTCHSFQFTEAQDREIQEVALFPILNVPEQTSGLQELP